MGYGFRTSHTKEGWKNDIQGREKAYAARDWCDLPEKIRQAAERLRGVQIENRPAADVIQRFNYPNVLIYADPPYMLQTRHGKQYRCEMTNKDHEELLDILLAHKGPVIISGYDSEPYRARLKSWHKEETISRTQSLVRKGEMLWMNFEPEEQMSLFLAEKGDG